MIVMSKFTEFAQAVGNDIKEIKDKQSSSLSISQAYGLFPTYNNFFQQVIEQNRFAEDPLVLKSQLPTSEIAALKQKVADLEAVESKIDNPNAGERRISPISYWYPDYQKADSKWNQAVTIKDNIGFVIINIDSGSGTVQPEHIEQAKRAKAVGANVLIYLPTGYGKFDIENLRIRYADYKDSMQGLVDGVFLDETINGFSEQASLIPKYKELSKAIKQANGVDTAIVANPGSNVVEELLDSADVFMNFESSADKYLEREITPDYCKRENSTKFWHCIFNVTKENYKQVLAKADKEHVGHIYLVDNPSYGNPAAPWLQEAMRDWVFKRQNLADRVSRLETTGVPTSTVSAPEMSVYKIPDEYFPASFKGKITAKMAVYGNAVDISIKVNEYIGSSTETDKDEATETWPSGLLDYAGNLTIPFTKYSSKQGYAPFLVVNASGKLTFRGSGMDASGACFGHINYLATNPTVPSGWTKF